LKIALDGHVIIIDEAHNLMDSICGIYSCSIALSQLQRGRQQLIAYLQRFRTRLKGKNRIYVAQIVRLLDSLIAYLLPKNVLKTPKDGEVQVNELLESKGVDQINLYKLNLYIQESRLARKVDGYTTHITTKDSPEHIKTPVLMQIQTFMLALMNPSSEGRFFYALEDGEVTLSYLLLDAAPHFQEVTSSARTVILAGGTMSPMDDYITHLFPHIDSNRIMTLSCGHIVPSSSLVVYPITKGPKGQDFEFNFGSRNKQNTITAAGETLLHIISVVPDGVVAFFPSYDYLKTCLDTWKNTKAPSSHSHSTCLFDAIRSVKPLFFEQKSSSPTTTPNPTQPTTTAQATPESLLVSYTNAIQAPSRPHQGALLLAVLSGSLSEGINFSDALGRCVIIVGLPFANPHSASQKARLTYISSRARSKAIAEGKSKAEAEDVGRRASSEFYVNATMRAVNQAVGRAIRHAKDYAAVVLIDKRYDEERISGKLPTWMKGSIVKGRKVSEVVKGLEGFFEQKAIEHV
jgi:chromosome transmission fidelity protein 1